MQQQSSVTKVPPVGTLIDEGRMSSLGRCIASGEMYINFNPNRWLNMNHKGLKRGKSVYEVIVDELGWDMELTKSRREWENLKASRDTAIRILALINNRLERWERLGERDKVAFLDNRRKRKHDDR